MRGHPCSFQVAAPNPIDGFLHQVFRDVPRLIVPDFVKRNIAVALGALLSVPLRLPVPNQKYALHQLATPRFFIFNLSSRRINGERTELENTHWRGRNRHRVDSENAVHKVELFDEPHAKIFAILPC